MMGPMNLDYALMNRTHAADEGYDAGQERER